MANQNLKLKSIGELLEYDFYIPSYQRGYRWDDRQVLDLLEDIDEFANKTKTKDEFYCLQPVVVSSDKALTAYKVIDGQQRLTTIYIILKYLEESAKKFQELRKKEENKEILEFCDIENFKVDKIYSIEYQTRKDETHNSKDFLENMLSKGISDKNPDFYYMSEAYNTIKEWFKTKSKKQFLETLKEKVKVIWYEVTCEDIKKEIEIFSRLNTGKIPLTNAELIKAMLLIPIDEYKSQIEFSATWDSIEQTLQEDDFWYFLTNKEKSETAIDIVFEILAQKYQNEYELDKSIQIGDDKYSYYIFDRVLKKDKTEAGIWRESQEVFRYLLDWYNDREIYHKIGYLLYFDSKILDLMKEYENKTKSIFLEYLGNKIKEKIKNIILEQLNYGDKKVKKVLLLFNIETLLQNENSNIRFQFSQFKNKSWDIEHIASQTDNINKEEWIKSVLKYTKGITKYRKYWLKKLIDNFETYQNKIIEKHDIKDISDENIKDNIGNLTLLDSKTNRGYGNAFFPIKRAIIIDEDSKGNFIPPATKNVFLKQYSNKLSDMMNWNEDDIKSYRNEIFNLLKKYDIKNDEEQKSE